MPSVCTICQHEDRAAIEDALLHGGSLRDVAGRYRVARSSLDRHKQHHLPIPIRQAQEIVARADREHNTQRGDDILAQLRELQQITIELLRYAAEARQIVGAAMLVKEARGNLELMAKLILQAQEQTANELLGHPEWLSFRSELSRVIAPFPDAREAVAAALARIGAGDAA